MKQSAVEWLADNLKMILPQSQFNDVLIQNIIEQAKEMEKQQQGYSEEDMKKAFCNGGNLDYSVLTSTEVGTKILNKLFEQFKKK